MSRKNICNYTYNYEPEMYRYIMSTNILNKKKNEMLLANYVRKVK